MLDKVIPTGLALLCGLLPDRHVLLSRRLFPRVNFTATAYIPWRRRGVSLEPGFPIGRRIRIPYRSAHPDPSPYRDFISLWCLSAPALIQTHWPFKFLFELLVALILHSDLDRLDIGHQGFLLREFVFRKVVFFVDEASRELDDAAKLEFVVGADPHAGAAEV